MKHLRPRLLILAACLLTAPLLVACGSGSASTATTPAPTSKPLTVVKVTESEFAITPSTFTLTPGDYDFQVTSTGKFPHDLHIVDSTGRELGNTIGRLANGDLVHVRVTLDKGTYKAFCAVADHQAKGMTATITVA